MATEILQNKEISGEEKEGGGSAICPKRADTCRKEEHKR